MNSIKKRIVAISVITAIALTAGWNISQNDSNIELSDLALNNIEALAGSAESTTCYDYCQEWSGSSGGGMACDCNRFVGKCKKWC